jgi:excinuclease ABC subunit A
MPPCARTARSPRGWLELRGITRNNLHGLDARFPLGAFCAVTGVSGSGKSSLVSQALVELVSAHLGHEPVVAEADDERRSVEAASWRSAHAAACMRAWTAIKRLVRVDQKPIGRTPRSNLATYTGLFDHVRKLFAATRMAKARRYERRPLLVQRGQGPLRNLRRRRLRQRGAAVHAQRLRALPHLPRRALQRQDAGGGMAGATSPQVLAMTVDEACEFFADEPVVQAAAAAAARHRPGLPAAGPAGHRAVGRRSAAHQAGHRTAAQPARRQRCMCSTSRPPGLHPADVDKLMAQLHGPGGRGNTVVVVEHEMRVVAAESDWVIDVGADDPGECAKRTTRGAQSATRRVLAADLHGDRTGSELSAAEDQ